MSKVLEARKCIAVLSMAGLLFFPPSHGSDNLAAREQWAQTHESGQKSLEQGNLDQAESLFKSAISQAKGLGYGGPLAASLYHLAKVYHQQGKKQDAETYYKQALEILDEQPRKNISVLVQLVKDYAKLLRETGREAEAVEQESRIRNPNLK
ncbi:MAG TPA: tetratricopeptide repeat protein [Candidatus Obscuribacterales bacterium]